MAEQSFPVVERPLTDDQWKSVTLGIGDGILDEGGNPYSLSVSNTGDNVTINLDTIKGYNHAILRGFYHKMDTAITLPVPAVSSETTYYVALQYDPTATDTPVKLGAWTSLDKANGKYYLEIARIKRQPNQLLTDAKITKYRPIITPCIQVDYPENLPPAATVLWGTEAQCWRTNERYRASWGQWVAIGSYRIDPLNPGGWATTTATGGIIVTPVQGGLMYTWQGGVTRTAADYTLDKEIPTGQFVSTAAAPDRAAWTIGLVAGKSIQVALRADGTLLFSPLDGNAVKIVKNAGVSFSLNWFHAIDPTTTS